MDYSGKIITKNAVTPTQTAASGVWTLDDALQAQKGNNWPIPGVPNPISKSLRFNSADSAYLNRTPAISGNRKKWTWSSWVKRSGLSAEVLLFRTVDGIANFNFYFTPNNTITVEIGATNLFTSTPVYRDVSAWYHIVLVFDSDNATADNRLILYVNGVSQAKASGSVSSGLQLPVNGPFIHYIGGSGSDRFINAYLTEINFVDGQALTPSDFGMTDTNTGVWIPKKYTGTYGTNGFYVNFKDATNTTTIGYDYSGNGNNWNANNFSVTAGAGNDSLTDVPTPWVGYGLNSEAGGVVRGNYATLNPLYGTGITANFYTTNGNLDLNVDTNSGYRNLAGTFSPENFKGYFEVYCPTDPNFHVGFAFESISPSNIQYQNAGTLYINSAGDVKDGLTTIKSGCTPSFSSTDVLQVAFDFTNGAKNVWFGRNGTWGSNASGVGVPSTGTNPVLTSSNITSASRFYFGINSGAGTVTAAFNFGQRPFAYTPPAGFLSLCTTNLPTPTIGATSTTQAGDYFNIALYTGNNSTNVITGLGFSPNLVWIKSRSNAENNLLFDTNRGRGYGLYSNLTNAEAGPSPSDKDLVSFDSDGFTLGQIYNFNVNDSGKTFVGWAWRGSDSAAVSNTAGSITSTVSANTTAGFSIVTYTGNATAGATVGHGLGVAPRMIIVKRRDASSNWAVGHTSIGWTHGLILNDTSAAATQATWWNDTAPTSTVFSLGTAVTTNTQFNPLVAYCFAQVAGYSAFGSYTGNGSTDGPFVYTGFRPRWLLFKDINNSSWPWIIVDTARNTYNVMNAYLSPNNSNAEATNFSGNAIIDATANGFKVRTSDAYTNTSNDNVIYAAFAEFPFKFANAR